VSEDERGLIQASAADVQRLLVAEPHDANALKKATAVLDDATQELAVRLVERAVEESLSRRGIT
jgi:molecular chaperone DnaK